MSGVPVTVGPPTDAGRLFPRYKNSIGILTLESGSHGVCPHGVNIDNSIILDFDEDRVLVGVELIAPMSAWKGKARVAPPFGKTGDIRLGGGLSTRVHYDWPVMVSKDVQRDMALITFGDSEFNRAVALSAKVSALLHDEHLIGFWFSFAP
jgi:hypothetical protein